MSDPHDSDPRDSDPHDSDPRDSDPRGLPSPGDGGCGDGALYLLGLLDERHSRMFVEHAGSCALCSDDLAALEPAVERLPTMARQVLAPAHAKRQVMAVVRSEAAQRGRHSSSRATQRAARSPRARGVARGRFALRPALGLAGTAVLMGGVAIGALSQPFGGGSTPAGSSSARVVSADVTLARASAALHESGGHTWLTVADMPQPSAGHVYEVWVKRPGRAEPQPTDSLFAPTSSGAATVAVPDGGGANVVMVTQEPAGGTRLPTAPAVIVARLS